MCGAVIALWGTPGLIMDLFDNVKFTHYESEQESWGSGTGVEKQQERGRGRATWEWWAGETGEVDTSCGRWDLWAARH